MRKLFLLFAIGLTQACAVNVHTPMDQQTRDSIASAELYSVVVQDEVKPAVSVSNSSAGAAAVGGILGMAIAASVDASKNKKRNREAGAILEPLWNATMDMDYRVLFADAMTKTLSQQFSLSQTPSSAHYAILSRAELSEKLGQLESGNALIYMLPEYGFVDNFKRLRSILRTFIYTPDSFQQSGRPKPVYQSILVLESANYGSGGEDSLTVWLNEDADLFRNEIQNGLASLGYILQKDLTGAYQACKNPASVTVEHFLNNKTAPMKGVLLEESSDLTLIRAKNGIYYAVVKADDEQVSTLAPDC